MISRIVSVFSTLRKHKKKTVFFSACFGLLANFGLKKKRDWDILRLYCQEAALLGRLTIAVDHRPRRVTVLLNALANDGKAKRLFEDNALPLLHLAGIEVTVIKPDSADQLEAMAAALDGQETDAVYVVGGDGTLARVLTGMYGGRSTAPALPVGAFPGGRRNSALCSLAPAVFTPNAQSSVIGYCESARALIHDVRRPLHVVKVQTGNDDDDEAAGSTVYSLSNVHGGWFRNIEEKQHKFWYWFQLKRPFSYFWEMLKSSPQPLTATVDYEVFCGGCNRCRQPVTTTASAPHQWRWWHILTGAPRQHRPLKPEEARRDYSTVENEQCGVRRQTSIEASDVLVETCQEEDSARVRLSADDGRAGRVGVIGEGCKRSSFRASDERFYAVHIDARRLQLAFDPLPEKCRSFSVAGDAKDLTAGRLKIESVAQPIVFYLPETISAFAAPSATAL